MALRLSANSAGASCSAKCSSPVSLLRASSVEICAQRAVAAIAPLLAVGGDGVEAAVGELGLAGQRLRLGAHLRGIVALDLDVGADRGELVLDLGGGRERDERRFGLLLAGARLVAAGGEPGLGFVECGHPRGVAGDLALRGRVQFTGCVGLAAARRAAGRGRRFPRPRRP